MKHLAMTAALMALAAPAAFAQGPLAVPPTAIPYPGAIDVPQNGCAWSGLAYSDGAIIQALPINYYFRCKRGSWQSFSSLSEATMRPQPEAEGSSAPPR